jgi:hypothetical protein
MKTFKEFIKEASKEEAQARLNALPPEERDKRHVRKVGRSGTENWGLKLKSSHQGQLSRRKTNLRPLSQSELEDHAKRNLYPSPKQTAQQAINIERSRKSSQTKERNRRQSETGQQHHIDHIVPQADKTKYPERHNRIRPGDVSDNRRVISKDENLAKNSRNTEKSTLTRSSAIRRALKRVG